ncbi:copper homeostasis protein CutC [Streptococcus gallinaceus]|uniref:PF03932 family protein CutC n=1 Tax=Streptococcus gallinaceus TaxID=165758 RepID=A0ABV2JMU3_9STRE|nr:copper homeostasis protein CutC [Streptococcus gallinaceus]MCP1640232.1 copper homeostasis protein [Streptococcus gallinaceus]MCP1770984.1 copper homeostasis protein [Streptococcus gallinaceus]
MIKEFCAENHTDIAAAIAAGAKRIELCDNLAVGGTTPSPGVVSYVCRLGEAHQVSVMTMIRPRGGNFVYTKDEIGIMMEDIAMARACGTDGVVFGALRPDHQLDKSSMEALIEASEGLEIVCHMAFDLLTPADQLEAIDWLASRGVTRILTHGGPAGTRIEDNFHWLAQLVNHAQGNIAILAGGGVSLENYQEVMAKTGVAEVHGTKICKL